MVLRSVGYAVSPIQDLPYDRNSRVIENKNGEITSIPFIYAVGWCADGPSGIIGTNKVRAKKVVQTIALSLDVIVKQNKSITKNTLSELLINRGCNWITKEDWLKVDQFELQKGLENNRIRERFASIREVFNFLGKA